jgi:hypothetical protein
MDGKSMLVDTTGHCLTMGIEIKKNSSKTAN